MGFKVKQMVDSEVDQRQPVLEQATGNQYYRHPSLRHGSQRSAFARIIQDPPGNPTRNQSHRNQQPANPLQLFDHLHMSGLTGNQSHKQPVLQPTGPTGTQSYRQPVLQATGPTGFQLSGFCRTR